MRFFCLDVAEKDEMFHLALNFSYFCSPNKRRDEDLVLTSKQRILFKHLILKYLQMEKRIGTVIIYVGDRQSAPQLNEVLSRHADIIVCRQGFPRPHYSLISVVLEGTTDRIGSLTGQLGRIEGIEVKSALLPIKN